MAKAKATTTPQSQPLPEGFKQIGGGYAATWIPEEGDVLQGETTSEVKTVEMTQGRKKIERRCFELMDDDSGLRYTIWESAALGDLFDTLVDLGSGVTVYIRYDGLGNIKKPGQNAPKLYTVAIADAPF